ncbi:MAG: hypothetical protein UU08_C0006G0042 [Candidatus Uhrbacteria bacterium GW2011_GWE2_40_58]|nr:MAG: hypothetical protein UT94_C0007G0006 [Candidatus Uhrbacteria bacterium GW2011_GWF2_40_263]KKR67923.1 MAG: hypothetical protein UU08_C0006G0042 [Candidatus Uhrbacteria bacterium GW2011_GWE2_40_58]OGL93935.1 MAG: hypothetical protein A2239_02470 [Candidatus Uhrbacteria bacterium RIFOXYA2_FULL_40_9]OGL96892.1 MAG: hypothetical protein A2332_02130 [Candidatus Uhrbacteria bacterium RIFOXYB2_FULL_41_18]HBK34513.1 hypothetical protein [Candidatus Uhrbacteria bacterium]
MISSHTQEATVVALEEDHFVFSLPNGQTIDWPRSCLAGKVDVHQTVHLLALTQTDLEKEKSVMARELLNELLQAKKDV